MPYTQADVDAQKAAMQAAANVASVELPDGYKIQYSTFQNAQALLELMQRDVDAANAAVPVTNPLQQPQRAVRLAYRSGY